MLVSVGVRELVNVGVIVGVLVSVVVLVSVGVGGYSVLVSVGELVNVGVAVSVCVGVAVNVCVLVNVGVTVGVSVGVGVGVGGGKAIQTSFDIQGFLQKTLKHISFAPTGPLLAPTFIYSPSDNTLQLPHLLGSRQVHNSDESLGEEE